MGNRCVSAQHERAAVLLGALCIVQASDPWFLFIDRLEAGAPKRAGGGGVRGGGEPPGAR